VRNKTKSYALIKARLRDAGMPTGGKKRKILQRLKALDEKEAHLHAMREEAHQNETRVEASKGGGGATWTSSWIPVWIPMSRRR